MIDFLNPPKDTEQTSLRYCDEQKGFIVEATEDLHKNQSVHLFKQAINNSHLLLNHGVVDPDNMLNQVSFTVGE